ncbi:MAG: DedA family protein [Phycisphaerales bacterium]|nr:DedA family protein [Phycisphaerales bacterium]
MGSLTEIVKHLADWCMQTGGLFGAGVLMALESMIAPVPSEVVMPPLGMAVYRGEHTWTMAIVATSIGSLIGSVISYYIGYFGGKPLVMKVGRFLLINEEHLDLTHRWFERRGSITVFVCRFVPVVRHFISIPAGIAKMNLLKFCLYTVIGATMWNSLLLWAGWYLENKWDTLVMPYRKPIDAVVIVAMVVAVAAWYWVHLRKSNSTHFTN